MLKSSQAFLIVAAILATPPCYCVLQEALHEHARRPAGQSGATRPRLQYLPPDTVLVDDAEALHSEFEYDKSISRVSIVCKSLKAEHLRALARRFDVTTLSIFGAKLNAGAVSALTELPQLTCLYLTDTRCSSADWRQLRQFGSLTELSFCGVDVPTDTLQEIADSLPRCEVTCERSPTIARSRNTDTEGGSVRDAILRAHQFYSGLAIAGGGYLAAYPADSSHRPATSNIHVPMTARVGDTWLAAYRATGDAGLLNSAVDVGSILTNTQLETGGWESNAELDPLRRRPYGYHADNKPTGYHGTYLDYPATRLSLTLLMELDVETDCEYPEIHQAAMFCLDSLLVAQYPNGSWPQWLKTSQLDDHDHPIRRASVAKSWSRIRSHEGFPHYRYHYTLNDNVVVEGIRLMLKASNVYDDPRFADAAIKGGDFLLLAQMPDPQPAWAQQYNSDMHPSWGRSFEPPAIVSRESQAAITALLDLYQRTGRPGYLRAAERALDYLNTCELPDGRFSRFYELETNRPLYVNRWYMLTYSDSHLLGHYALKQGNVVDSLTAYANALKAGKPPVVREAKPVDQDHILGLVQAMNEHGGWANNDGSFHIETMIQNTQTLCAELTNDSAIASVDP